MAYLGNNSLPFDPTRTTPAPRDADRFSGNGSTTAFTLSRSVSAAVDIEVFVENVQQEPITAYDVNGTSLTFTGAPASGTNNIYVVYRNFQSGAQVTMPDGSVTYSKLANNLRIFTTDNLTPNGNNAVFTLSEPPADANTVMVTVDGVVQRAPVHYTTSGSTITFTSNPPAGSNVHVRHLGFRTSTTVTQLAANSTISNPVITGTVTGGATFQAPTINAASITGNTAIPNGSQLLFNSASVTFDIKPVTGARDQLYLRSTWSGNTYNGMIVDYLGYVTTPLQPMLSCYSAGTNGTSLASFFAIGQSSPDLNIGSHFNTTTRLFTCPIAGNYRVTVTITNGDGQYHYAYPVKNGTVQGYALLCYSTYNTATGSVIISCAAGDTLGAVNRYNTGLYGAHLSIELIG